MMSSILVTALWLFLQQASVWAEVSVVAAPRAVHFHSVNLRNRLRWTPGRGAPSHTTTYTVEYAIYGDAVEERSNEQAAWRVVKQCTDITETVCDLTEQTDDLQEEYYGRVRVSGPNASSEWTETKGRFRAMSETILGPPRMTVTLKENYLQVLLKGPFRSSSRKMRGHQSLWSIFPHMVYNISVYNNRTKHTYFFLRDNGSLTLGPLDFDTDFCVMAESHSLSLPLHSQHTPPTCVKTSRDPFTTQMLVMMLGGLVPTAICLFVLTGLGCFMYHYIHGPSEKPPQSTQDMVHITEKWQMFQPEKPLIINLNLDATTICTGNPELGLLGALYHSTEETERLLPVKAHPLSAIAPPSGGSVMEESHEGPYAAQNVPQMTGSEVASETPSETASSSWCDDSYGLVLHMLLKQDDQQGSQQDSQQDDQQDGHQDASGLTQIPASDVRTEQPCEVNTYTSQNREKDPGDERCEEEEEERGLNLDWNPQTGVLKIPLLCPLDFEDQDRSATEEGVEGRVEGSVDSELLQHRPILTSVVVRQTLEECREEDVFAKMEEVWGLQIQSSIQ